MGRFLASSLAGILVIVGGWFGWTRAGEVDSAVAGVARGLLPGSESPTASRSRGASPPGMRIDRDASLTATSSPRAEPCHRSRPSGADGMDRLVDALDEEPMLQGGDHGGSTPLADGRRMFVYGDTIRDSETISPFMVRNSVLVADEGCVQPMVGPSGTAVIPDDDDGTGYWPMSLRSTAINGGTRVEVITNRVRDVGDDSFETLGSSLATFEVPHGRMPTLVKHTPLVPDPEDHRVPTWGAAMWDDGDKTYVFGTASNEDKSTSGWSLHVARTDHDSLGDTDAWEYWDGSRWSATAPSTSDARSGALIPADRGVSHVLSVFERHGTWYAVSKEGDFTGDRLAVWKADSVTGEWNKHIVRSLPNSGNIQRYTPLAHPDFSTPTGTLLISWSESPEDHSLYHSRPELYRPEFEEIELP